MGVAAVGHVGRTAAPGRRVVVLGAGLAGLLAAAAASGDGRRVTVLERDVLPDRPQPRDGVPQGRQPHVFLHRGLRAIEELLPGFAEQLAAAGAVALDTGDLAWLGASGWAPTGRRELPILSATRPLFEQEVRRRVRALPGVTVRDGVRVRGLRRGRGQRWWVDLSEGEAVDADLVIDATGRTSRLPVWLADLGVGPVPTTTLDVRVGYASRLYEVPPGRLQAAGVVVLQAPGRPVGSFVLPVEESRWQVAAIGSGGRRPPRDPDGFEAFLVDLPDRSVSELARGGTPVTDVAVHRQTGNRRHHVERLRDWPAGLLVLGDALCAFNPVYGQGVTVAAMEAVALRRALRRGLRPGGERRLLRRFGRIASLPWAIATGEDRRYLADPAPTTTAVTVLAWWTRELWRLSGHGDRLAHGAIARVYHLVTAPWLLVRPRLVWHVLRARLRGYGPPSPPPRVLADGDGHRVDPPG